MVWGDACLGKPLGENGPVLCVDNFLKFGDGRHIYGGVQLLFSQLKQLVLSSPLGIRCAGNLRPAWPTSFAGLLPHSIIDSTEARADTGNSTQIFAPQVAEYLYPKVIMKLVKYVRKIHSSLSTRGYYHVDETLSAGPPDPLKHSSGGSARE